MSYENTKHKFRTIYVKTNNNEHDLANINLVKNNYFVMQFHTNPGYIEINDIDVNYSTSMVITIELSNMSEELISSLRHLLVFYTSEGFLTNSSYLTYVPKYQCILESTSQQYLFHISISPHGLPTIPIKVNIKLYLFNRRLV